MEPAELRKIAEESKGNTFNNYQIDNIENFYPNAKYVVDCKYMPVHGMVITKVVNRLSDPSFPKVNLTAIDFKRYKIHEKEDYNHLKRWKEDIKQYAPYRKKMDEIYKSFSDMGQNKREAVYQWLHREYARLHDDLEADKLFDALKDHVSGLVRSDIDLFDCVSNEEMENHVCVVLVDAFIECRIFEKPV